MFCDSYRISCTIYCRGDVQVLVVTDIPFFTFVLTGSDAWLTLSNFDMTPDPVEIPGHPTLTLHGVNGEHAFASHGCTAVFALRTV